MNAMSMSLIERERERVSVHGWCRTVCPIMYARECVMIERQKEREREGEGGVMFSNDHDF